MHDVGRPSIFSDEIADAICEQLSEGKSLVSICRAEGMPCTSTVFKWLKQNQSFMDSYALAREAQADALFDESLDIADDGRNDWMASNAEGDEGWRANGENIQRSRLRIDTRKWMAGKLRPKKYGEKIEHEHSGSINTVLPTMPTPEEWAKRHSEGGGD